MSILFLLILAGVAAYFLLRPRQLREDAPGSPAYYGGPFGGAGSMLTGMVLGYLLSNYLIDQRQYDMWRDLTPDALRDILASQGVMSGTDFDALAQKALAGELQPQDLLFGGGGDSAGWPDNDGGFVGSDDGGFDDFGDGIGGDGF